MSFQPPGAGSVHREYLPAGTGAPAITRSALVSNTVAWFAPVRHTWFQGTTFPKITRPRIDGRLYQTAMDVPATRARTESGGDRVPSERAANDLPSPAKSRTRTRSTVICAVPP